MHINEKTLTPDQICLRRMLLDIHFRDRAPTNSRTPWSYIRSFYFILSDILFVRLEITSSVAFLKEKTLEHVNGFACLRRYLLAHSKLLSIL
mmetsp:Transcript_33964/g.82137  ORF Transcript_33964/g.82137 Transcript_33964/m.82137 type:complete len:92 (-) Transcript_33964:182-457(-)